MRPPNRGLAALTTLVTLGASLGGLARPALADGPAGESRVLVQEAAPLPPPPAPLWPAPLPPDLQALVPLPPDQLFLKSARRMRNTGIALTIVGVALGISSGIAFASVPAPRRTPCMSREIFGCLGDAIGESLDRGIPMVIGSTLAIMAAGTFIPGVILWPVGQGRLNAARASFAPGPAGSLGGGLRLDF